MPEGASPAKDQLVCGKALSDGEGQGALSHLSQVRLERILQGFYKVLAFIWIFMRKKPILGPKKQEQGSVSCTVHPVSTGLTCFPFQKMTVREKEIDHVSPCSHSAGGQQWWWVKERGHRFTKWSEGHNSHLCMGFILKHII